MAANYAAFDPPSGTTSLPFDRDLSLHIDRLIVQIDQRPSRPQRWVLRLCKRVAERRIPRAMLWDVSAPAGQRREREREVLV